MQCQPNAEPEALVWAAMAYGGLKAWLKQWVLRRWRKVCDEEQAWMPAGSEFHTEGTATLKPREAKVVWTDFRLQCPWLQGVAKNDQTPKMWLLGNTWELSATFYTFV